MAHNPGSTRIRLVAHWIRANLFRDLPNTLVSVAAIAGILWVLARLLNWAVWQASWVETCRAIVPRPPGPEASGACWTVLVDNAGILAFGFYPPELWWRPILALLLLPVALAPICVRSLPRGWLVVPGFYPVIAYALIWGAFGLAPVSSERIGGFLLTLIIAIPGAPLALLLGIAFALIRRNAILPIRALIAAILGVFRAIPLIVFVVTGFLLKGLPLPFWIFIDPITFFTLLISLATGARIAEALQPQLVAIPSGQREAARSLGFSGRGAFWIVILPQAMHGASPQIVLILAGLLRDTTFVMFVGLLDPLQLASVIRVYPDWNSAFFEVLFAVGLIYGLMSFAMARYACHLQRRDAARNPHPVNLTQVPRQHPAPFATPS
ncbi:MAG: ABC transporter permease subunit [Pseudomonadota bacterium]